MGGSRRKEGRESRAPAIAVAEPAGAATFPGVAGRPVEAECWMGEASHLHRKGSWIFCLQVKRVAEGEQKAFWKMVGLRRTLDESILRERSRSKWKRRWRAGENPV